MDIVPIIEPEVQAIELRGWENVINQAKTTMRVDGYVPPMNL